MIGYHLAGQFQFPAEFLFLLIHQEIFQIGTQIEGTGNDNDQDDQNKGGKDFKVPAQAHIFRSGNGIRPP